MKGIDLINFIKENNLEDMEVSVTATHYYQGDHDCITTRKIYVDKSSVYDRVLKKHIPTIDLYVSDELNN